MHGFIRLAFQWMQHQQGMAMFSLYLHVVEMVDICLPVARVCSSDTKTINVTFMDEKDGSTKTVQAPVGENLMEVAHRNYIDL